MDAPFVPRRRSSGLVTEAIDGETLLYVEETHKAFCLNAPAARVWESIDGTRDIKAISAAVALDPALVSKALREIADAGLLANAPNELPMLEVDLSRRRMVRTGLLAIPFILAITVPRAAEAASQCTVGLPGGPACSPTTPCCAGICNENFGTCG